MSRSWLLKITLRTNTNVVMFPINFMGCITSNVFALPFFYINFPYLVNTYLTVNKCWYQRGSPHIKAKVLKELTRVDIYSVNNFWFKQWVITYCTNNVTHSLDINAPKVIWNKFQWRIWFTLQTLENLWYSIDRNFMSRWILKFAIWS